MNQEMGEIGSAGVVRERPRVGDEKVLSIATVAPRDVRSCRRNSMSERAEEFRSNLMLILQSIYPIDGLPLLQVESEYLKYFRSVLNLSSFENFFLLKVPKNPEGATDESRTEAVLAELFSVEPFSKYFKVRIDQDTVTGKPGCPRVFCTSVRNQIEMIAIAKLSTHSNMRLVINDVLKGSDVEEMSDYERDEYSSSNNAVTPDRLGDASDIINNEPCDELRNGGAGNEQRGDGKSGSPTSRIGDPNAAAKITPKCNRRSSSRIKKPVDKYDAFQMDGAKRRRNRSSIKNEKYIDLSQDDVVTDPTQADGAVDAAQTDAVAGPSQADVAVDAAQTNAISDVPQADVAFAAAQTNAVADLTQAEVAVDHPQADVLKNVSKRRPVAEYTHLPSQPQTSMISIREKLQSSRSQKHVKAVSRQIPNIERPRPITLTNHLGEVKVINVSVPCHTCRLCGLKFDEDKPFIDHMGPLKNAMTMTCDACKSPFKSKCSITAHHFKKECRIYTAKRTFSETASTGDDCNANNIIAKKSPVCVDLTGDNDSSED